LKILVLSHLYPSSILPVWGIFVHQQVKALQEKGHQVTVISPAFWTPKILTYFSKKWKRYFLIPRIESFEGVEVYHPRFIVLPRAWFKYLYGYSYYFSIRKIFKYKSFDFDIILAHTALPDGYAGLLVRARYNVPVVTTIHGVSVYSLVNKNRYCRQAVQKVLRESDTIVAVSTAIKKLVYRYSKRENNVYVVANGIPIQDIRDISCQNETMKLTKDKKVLLTVGFLIKRKGHEYLINALPHVLEEVDNFTCFIIGDGNEKKNLEKLVHSLNLTEYVKFLGSLPHKQTLGYMSTCDVFVLPSWDEAFGVVYIEAMVFGKPIIGCKGEGLEDFVKNGETGLLVEAKDVISLKTAIIKLLSNNVLADRIGERGKEIIETHYTWGNNAEKMEKIFQKLL